MMNCVILAGGQGTRLQPVVKDVPKPMADIGGRPFLEILMEHLASCGAKRFVLCVCHMREAITSYFGGSYRGIPITYAVEETPMGTGGAIRNAFGIEAMEAALVVNGDTLLNADYDIFWQCSQNDDLSIMLTKVEDSSRYGTVEVDDRNVTRFREKTGCKCPGLINAGIYKISRKLALSMPSGSFSFEKDFLAQRVQELKPGYCLSMGYFMDIGLPETYAAAQKELAAKFCGKELKNA